VPLLDKCLRDQLAATPRHLVIDLQPVRFLDATGLTCLLHARHLAQQTPGTQLHLSGLINRVVRRVLDITGVHGLFSYLTRTHTRAVLVQTMGSPIVDPPAAPCHGITTDSPAPADGNLTAPAVLAAVWCSSAGVTWTLELREVTPDDQFGTLVDSISSDVPVSQPAPDAQVQELVAARGLWLFCESPAGPRTRDRYHFGYVSIDTEL
jgi:anti-anti-sigma factor